MGTIHLELSADLQALIDHQVAEGRVPDARSFLTEAAQRFADDLAWEEDVAEVARLGIADIEAGRFTTIDSQEAAEAWMEERLANVRARIARD